MSVASFRTADVNLFGSGYPRSGQGICACIVAVLLLTIVVAARAVLCGKETKGAFPPGPRVYDLSCKIKTSLEFCLALVRGQKL